MKTSDQWFEPGDKVMRVSYSQPGEGRRIREVRKSPQYGEVLCVMECWEGPTCNVVDFVGFGGPDYDAASGLRWGWEATCFRKVEELQLCVQAVERAKKPQEAKV